MTVTAGTMLATYLGCTARATMLNLHFKDRGANCGDFGLGSRISFYKEQQADMTRTLIHVHAK